MSARPAHRADCPPETVPSVLIAEAARRLSVSRRSVYYWIRDGLLETVYAKQTQRVTVTSLEHLATTGRPDRRRRVRHQASPILAAIESIAAGLEDAASRVKLQDFISEDDEGWRQLVQLVGRDSSSSRPMPLCDRDALEDTFSDSLSPTQREQYAMLTDDDVDRLVIDLQAAFELGRQYERARSNDGAR